MGRIGNYYYKDDDKEDKVQTPSQVAREENQSSGQLGSIYYSDTYKPVYPKEQELPTTSPVQKVEQEPVVEEKKSGLNSILDKLSNVIKTIQSEGLGKLSSIDTATQKVGRKEGDLLAGAMPQSELEQRETAMKKQVGLEASSKTVTEKELLLKKRDNPLEYLINRPYAKTDEGYLVGDVDKDPMEAMQYRLEKSAEFYKSLSAEDKIRIKSPDFVDEDTYFYVATEARDTISRIENEITFLEQSLDGAEGKDKTQTENRIEELRNQIGGLEMIEKGVYNNRNALSAITDFFTNKESIPLLGGVFTAEEAVVLLNAYNKMEKGEDLSEREKMLIEKDDRGETIEYLTNNYDLGYEITSGLLGSLSMMAEFILAGAIFKAVGLSAEGISVGAKATSKLASVSGKVATGILKTGAKAGQVTLTAGAGRIVTEATERQTPVYQYYWETGENVKTAEGEDPATAWTKAIALEYGNNVIEVMFDGMGSADDIAKNVLRQGAIQGFPQEFSEEILQKFWEEAVIDGKQIVLPKDYVDSNTQFTFTPRELVTIGAVTLTLGSISSALDKGEISKTEADYMAEQLQPKIQEVYDKADGRTQEELKSQLEEEKKNNPIDGTDYDNVIEEVGTQESTRYDELIADIEQAGQETTQGTTEETPMVKETSSVIEELEIPEAVQEEATNDWEENYAEPYQDLYDQVTELEKQIKEVKKAEAPALQERIDSLNSKMGKMEDEFVNKYQEQVKTEVPKKETAIITKEQANKMTIEEIKTELDNRGIQYTESTPKNVLRNAVANNQGYGNTTQEVLDTYLDTHASKELTALEYWLDSNHSSYLVDFTKEDVLELAKNDKRFVSKKTPKKPQKEKEPAKQKKMKEVKKASKEVKRISMEDVRKEAKEYPRASNFAYIANRKYGMSTEQATEIWNEVNKKKAKIGKETKIEGLVGENQKRFIYKDYEFITTESTPRATPSPVPLDTSKKVLMLYGQTEDGWTFVENKIGLEPFTDKQLDEFIGKYKDRLIKQAPKEQKAGDDKVAMLESKAQGEYEKSWDKLTPKQQHQTLMNLEKGERYIKTNNEDVLVKIGKGVDVLSLKDTATMDRQEIFLWGGMREGVYTDGMILFTDKPVVKKIIEKFQNQYLTKNAQLLKKQQGIPLAEAKKGILSTFTKQRIDDMAFPEYQQILDSAKMNSKLEPIGFYTDTMRSTGSIIFKADNGTFVRMSGKYYSAIKGFYPNVEFYITDESPVKPISFAVNGDRKGLVMPMMLPNDTTYESLVGTREAEEFKRQEEARLEEESRIRREKLQKEMDEAKKEKKKEKEIDPLEGDDLPFRRDASGRQVLDSTKLNDMDLAEMKRISRQILGDENVKILERIMTPESQRAMGRYMDNWIEIRAGSVDKGSTFYHEAVHKALDIFLTPEEKALLIKEVRSTVGDKYLKMEFSKLTSTEKTRLMSYASNATRSFVDNQAFIRKVPMGTQEIADSLEWTGNKELLDSYARDFGIEPEDMWGSSVQSIDAKTGERTIYLVNGEIDATHAQALIDNTEFGIAGEELDGKTWHITALTRKDFTNPYTIVEGVFDPSQLPYSKDLSQQGKQREYRIQFGITKGGNGKFRGQVTQDMTLDMMAEEWLAENIIDHINTRTPQTFIGKLKRMVEQFVDRWFKTMDDIDGIENFYEGLLSGRLVERQRQQELQNRKDFRKYVTDLQENTFPSYRKEVINKFPRNFLKIAKRFGNAQDFVDHFRGSSTQYGEYTPQLRIFGVSETSARISDLGVDPELKITIYRGIDDSEGSIKNPQIKDGDFVTTDYDSANAYTGGTVVSKEVKAKDLIIEFEEDFDIEDPFYIGAEFIYSSSKNQLVKYTDEDLAEMYRTAKESGSYKTVEELEKEKKYVLKNGTIPDTADMEGFRNSKFFNMFGENGSKSEYYEYISEEIDKINFNPKFRTEEDEDIIVRLPELVTIATELGTNVSLSGRMKTNLGVFQHKTGEGLDSTAIKLNALLFEPQGEVVLNAKGEEERLPETPEQQMIRVRAIERTLAHEIGHFFDWFGGEKNMTLSRGNIVGRIGNLLGYMKKEYAGYKNKEIMAELKELTQIWKPFDESKAPEKYIKYRYSSKELYADAISVLLNNPKLLKQTAPKFYQGFIEFVGRKKEVKEELFKIMDMIKEGQNIANRLDNMDKNFAEGTGRRMNSIERREAGKKQREWENVMSKIKFSVVDQHAPYLDKLRQLYKEGGIELSKLQESEMLMDNMDFIGDKQSLYAKEVQKEFFDPISEAGVSVNDIGKILVLERDMGDRADLANPQGLQYDYAKETYDKLKKKFTPAQWLVLQERINWFREYNFNLVKEGFEAGVYSKKFFDEIATVNKNTYTPFAVVEYINDNYVTAGVIQAKGTLKGVENPINTQMLKSMELIRLTTTNLAKTDIVKTLQENFPDEIKEAQAVRGEDGYVKLFKRDPEMADKGYEQLELLVDGKRTAFYVDGFIKESFDKLLDNSTAQAVRLLFTPVRIFNRIFKPLVTTFKPSFQFYSNPIKDVKDSLNNLSALSAYFDQDNRGVALRTGKVYKAFLKEWIGSLKQSWDYAGNRMDKVTEKMLEVHAISGQIKYEDIEIGTDEIKFDAIKNRVVHRGKVNWADSVIDFTGNVPILKQTIYPLVKLYQRLGQTLEVNSKVAGFKYFKEQGLDDKTAGLYTRKYVGTPNFMQKGKFTPILNEVQVFSNVQVQAVGRSLELGTSKKTASGYWFSMFFSTILPKLVMVAGATLLKVPIPDPDDEDETIWVNPFDYMSEYDKSNYITIPIGYDNTTKKWLYLRIPMAETEQMVGSAVWKMARVLQGEGVKTEQLAVAVAGQIPFLGLLTGGQDSPFTSILGGWVDYTQGKNPYDDFRGRPAISQSKWEEGGTTRLTEMIKWSTNEIGLTNFVTYDKDLNTTYEAVLQAPILERMFRLSDYGITEKEQWLEDMGKREKNKTLDTVLESYYAQPSDKNLIKYQEEYVKAIKGEAPKDGWTGTDKAEETRLKQDFKREILANSGSEFKAIAKNGLSNDEKTKMLDIKRKTMDSDEFSDYLAQVVRYEVVKGEMFAEYAKDKKLDDKIIYNVVKQSIPVLSADNNNTLVTELRKAGLLSNNSLTELRNNGLVTSVGYKKYLGILPEGTRNERPESGRIKRPERANF